MLQNWKNSGQHLVQTSNVSIFLGTTPDFAGSFCRGAAHQSWQRALQLLDGAEGKKLELDVVPCPETTLKNWCFHSRVPPNFGVLCENCQNLDALGATPQEWAVFNTPVDWWLVGGLYYHILPIILGNYCTNPRTGNLDQPPSIMESEQGFEHGSKWRLP